MNSPEDPPALGATDPMENLESAHDPPTYETKYVLPRWRVRPLTSWLDARCVPDAEYAHGHVRTLYFDTIDLQSLAEKTGGDLHKTKIRLRWYAPSADSTALGSAWVEVKQKVGPRRFKTRIRIESWAHEVDEVGPDGVDIDRVIHLVRAEGIHVPSSTRPSLALSYSRDRWVEVQTGMRIALDRDIQPTWVRGRGSVPVRSFELGVGVLEFKGHDREVPSIVRLITRFGAHKTSFCKYSECYAQLLVKGRPTGETSFDRELLA